MSPDIALSIIAARASSDTTTTSEKEKSTPLSPIHKSPSGTDIAVTNAAESPHSSSTNLFSLLPLKSFFTLPGPALPSGTVRKMPVFLMVATTALLFTCGGNLVPVVNAGVVPPSPASSADSDSLSVQVYTHERQNHDEHGPDQAWNTAMADGGVRPTYAAVAPTPISRIQNHHAMMPRDTQQQKQAGTPPSSPPQPGPIAWNTPCTHPGEEGIWNCMTTTWQRCVQGRWSVIMRSEKSGADEPDDTVCVPSGISPSVKFVTRGEQAAPMAAPSGGAASEGGADGTEAKWGGGGQGQGRVWGGGPYWSAAGEGVTLRGNRSSTRDRMVFVLGVAGVVGFVLGLPPVVV